MNERELSIVVKMVDQASRDLKQVQQKLKDVDNTTKTASRSLALMRRGLAAVGSAASGLGRALTGVRAALSAFLALAGIGRAAGALNNLSNEIDGVNDAAERLGVTTRTLSGLQLGAALTGGSPEQATAALSRLSKTIGDAAAGNKEAAKSFEELGVAITRPDGSTKPTEQVLRDVADAISRLPGPAERAAAAAAIFGREAGPALLNSLSKGKAGIEEFIAVADAYGVAIGPRLAEINAAFRDSIDRLGLSVKGAAMVFLREFLPTLTDLINGLSELIRRNRELIGTFLSEFLKNSASVLEKVGNIVLGLPEIFNAVVEYISDSLAYLPKRFEEFGNVIKQIATGIKESLIGIIRQALAEFVSNIALTIQQTSDALSKSGLGGVLGVSGASEGAVESLTTFSVELRKSGDNFANAEKAFAEAKAAAIRATQFAPSSTQPGVNVNQQFAGRISDVYNNGRVTQGANALRNMGADAVPFPQGSVEQAEAATRALEDAKKAVANVGTTADDSKRRITGLMDGINQAGVGIKAGFDKYADTLRTAGGIQERFASMTSSAFQTLEGNIQGAFESIIDGSMSAQEALQSFLQSFVKMLVSLAAQLLTVISLAIIFNVLTGGALSAAGVATTASSLGSATGMLGMIGGAAGAGGGTTPTTKAATPMISPSRSNPSAMGGTTVYNVSAMDAKSFSEWVNQRENSAAVTKAVTAYGPRNPGYRDGVKGSMT